MKKKTKKKTKKVKEVVIEVSGGVAEVTKCPKGVKVTIKDWDNEEGA